jgi:hypothetical protein
MAEDHERWVEEVAADALDALDTPSRARVAAHLRECAACAQLREDYRAVVGLLPHALTPAVPPAAVRAALLARAQARRTRLAVMVATLRHAAPRLLPRPLNVKVVIPITPGMRHAAPRLLPRPRLRWVALGALVVGLLGWNLRLQVATHGPLLTISHLARQPHGQVGTLIGTGAAPEASGRLYVDAEDAWAGLAVSGLPALPPGRVYQLWFIRADGQRVSGGTFRVDGRGEAALIMAAPALVEQVVGISVTEEPAGGSVAPTGRALLIGTL